MSVKSDNQKIEKLLKTLGKLDVGKKIVSINSKYVTVKLPCDVFDLVIETIKSCDKDNEQAVVVEGCV